LKGDVTRTGKRTIGGMFDDGFNAITRYYVNNFQDGVRQDAMDLFLGNCVVEKSNRTMSSMLKDESLMWILTLLIALFNIVAPVQVRYRYQIMVLAFVMFFVILISKLLRVRARKVVNIPQLTRRTKQKTG